LEEAMIRATAEFGIAAGREAGKTGVWVGEGKTSEKLAAIGVHVSRWVTSHGLAYNVSTDLRNFDLIVPCGIADRKATSLEKLLGRSVKVDEVKPKLAAHLAEVFGLELQQIDHSELLEKLETAEQPVAATA
jgi:lipoyl(octanoyl) transferase